MTGHVSIVGAGPGDPELLTRKAVARLRTADLVLYDALVDIRVLDFAKRARRFYVGKRAGRHAISQTAIHALMIRAARKGRRVVRLKGGDPFVFGRGGEEALALRAAGVPFDVVPGVTNAVAAPALAGIPVTHRGLSSAFLVVGGHDEAAFASAIGQLQPNGVTVVVLMGVGRAAGLASILIDRGWSRGTPAAMVSGASTPRQQAWYGRLDEMAADVLAAFDQGNEDPGTLIIGDVVAIAARIGAADDGAEAPAAMPAAASAKRAAGARHQRVGVGPHESMENEVRHVGR
jgi:uroporphyrin-III C-methyltransferase/precorrin-2 dehydrogenase/sirohydrochlorin ferrochelatase